MFCVHRHGGDATQNPRSGLHPDTLPTLYGTGLKSVPVHRFLSLFRNPIVQLLIQAFCLFVQFFTVCGFVIEIERIEFFEQQQCLPTDKLRDVQRGGFLLVHVSFFPLHDEYCVKMSGSHCDA